MPTSVRALAFLALGLGMATVSNAAVPTSGSGKTTRYWDCCKGSCSWPDKAPVSAPVGTCSKDDSPLTSSDAANTASGCDGGDAYMCSDQSPWAVSADLAYGFAAVHIPGGSESDWCCGCYELTFTTTSIAGKKMIVQATNTGGDLAEGQFDLAIPGGGVGLFNACTAQYGAPPNGWGAQYGGISTDTCSTFPSALEPGCSFRFGDFFEGADNPEVEWKQVTCPKALTDKTGCVRNGETPTGSGDAGSGSGSGSGSDVKPVTTKTNTKTTASSTSSSSSIADAVSPTEPAETDAPVENMPHPSPSYGTTTAAGPTYTSAASSSSSSSSSLAGPIGGTGSGPFPPAPTGGDEEQCAIEYVYVDENGM